MKPSRVMERTVALRADRGVKVSSLTSSMWDELGQTLATEDAGHGEREGRWFQPSALRALLARGLVEFHVTGYRLTAAGRKVMKR